MQNSDVVRASDSDREAVVEQLRVAAAEGRLTLEELAARAESAYRARTSADLATITADLPVVSPQATRPSPSVRRRIVSVFGDITREGSWRAHETMSPISVFGDIGLDLRHATVPVNGVTITATSPCGNIEVLVPTGVEVDVAGFTLFGSKKVAVQADTAGQSTATVRVKAFSIFGSIKVWTP